MKRMDGPGRSSGPVHVADDSQWDDKSTAQHAMNVEDAAIDFLPLTFEQSQPFSLPPDFHMSSLCQCYH